MLTIVPANESSCDDLQAVFGARAPAASCRCQRYKLRPRTGYEGLVRNNRVPWDGRDEDKSDDSVWSVTSVFVRAGFRRRGSPTTSRGRPSPSRAIGDFQPRSYS